MKKNLIALSILVTSVALVSSCKKDINAIGAKSALVAPESYSKRTEFAKVLAKSIAEEPLLREKIKTEALKQFDHDYDVLFQAVKDDVLPDHETVIGKLAKYASSKTDFVEMVNSLPLLTIYVPELPDFSAESWKTANEVPVVAIKPVNRLTDVEFYNARGEKDVIKTGYIPGAATLVIKDNERIAVGDKAMGLKANSTTTPFANGSDVSKSYLNKGGYNYSFISSSFDNTSPNSKLSVNRQANQEDPGNHPFDPVVIAAYKAGGEWQRDYVYYGIDPAAGITTGKFRNNYSEFITSFRFIHGYDFDNLHVGDHADDQNPTKNGGFYGSIVEWTGGNLEMRISILLNAKSGSGQELRKIFSVKTSDLFTVKYIRASSGGRPPYAMKYDGLEPKDFFPNIELVPFDLDTYGTTWKFIISEYDPSEEITTNVTNTTVIANNFEVNVSTGEKIKVGAKFGTSITTTQSSSFQRKTTTGSDDLGEGILDFRSPIITGSEKGNVKFYKPGETTPTILYGVDYYSSYEVTTGVISMSVEPQKIY